MTNGRIVNLRFNTILNESIYEFHFSVIYV